jgi:hypothetical protein
MNTAKFLIVSLSAFILLTIGCESKGGGSNNLPPELEGIDSNNDGVRDDLEIAIYEYASKPEEENLRRAMRQDAKAAQLAIIAGHTKDPQKVEEARLAISRSSLCRLEQMDRFGISQSKFSDTGRYMERKAANTPERLEAYLRYNEALSGRVFSSIKDSNPCD